MKIMFPESKTLTCCCKEKDPEPLQAKLERLLDVDQEISIQALLGMDWIQPIDVGSMLCQAWFERDYDWAGPSLARKEDEYEIAIP